MLVVCFAVSCSQELRKHGYVPPPEDLEKIQVGVSTRSSVMEALGAPSSTGVLDGGPFLYINQYKPKYGFRVQKVVKLDGVQIDFDGRDRVSNVTRFDIEDGRVVSLDRRITDSGANNSTFLRQLVGNLTNFNPGVVTGDG